MAIRDFSEKYSADWDAPPGRYGLTLTAAELTLVKEALLTTYISRVNDAEKWNAIAGRSGNPTDRAIAHDLTGYANELVAFFNRLTFAAFGSPTVPTSEPYQAQAWEAHGTEGS